MIEPRITEKEARAFAVAGCIGITPGANFFASHFGITKSRAQELEALQFDFTDAEIGLIAKAVEETA